MACYKCYFDGSHQYNAGGMSGCAFYVELDGHGLYSHVQHEKLQASHVAERRALYLLFMYIGNNIEPGSAVQVFGDAKGVIESVKAKGSARRGKKNIRKLYRALSRDYALTLQFIPRQQNKTAHNLSRSAPPDSEPALPKPRKSRGLTKNHVMLGTINVFIDDIRIPGYILYGHPPNKEKYQERLNYYLEHGCECKTIQIDPDGVLLDGYISYLILKEHGITRCRVEVMADLTHPAL